MPFVGEMCRSNMRTAKAMVSTCLQLKCKRGTSPLNGNSLGGHGHGQCSGLFVCGKRDNIQSASDDTVDE